MKNKLMIIGIAIILMLASSTTVFAADYADLETTLTLSADKNEVKAGETFTVTLKATCPDGINGVVTTYSYEEDKLEYVSENVVDTNYAFGGNKNAKEIFVYCTSTDSIQSADVYAITFRVKEGVEANSTATISLTESTLDSDAATDSEHTIPAQQVTVTVVEAPTEDGDGTTPPAEDEGDGETTPPAEDEGDGETPPTTEDEGEQTPPPTQDEGEDKKQPTTEGTTVVVGDDKDDTTAKKEYDKAGINTTLVIATVIVAIVGIIIYRKSKNYEDII